MEILGDFFKRYGLSAIVAALVVAAAIWYLAQSNAEPGTTVKVLWGLVEYTKVGGGRGEDPTAAPRTAIEQPSGLSSPASKSVNVQNESASSGQGMSMASKGVSAQNESAGTGISAATKTVQNIVGKQSMAVENRGVKSQIRVAHGLTPVTAAAALTAIRSRNSLRPLRDLETGRSLADSPEGTFFYVSPFTLVFGPNDPFPSNSGLIGQAPINDEKYFEVQHRSDGGLYIIAFAAEVDADRIRRLRDGEAVSVTVSPKLWEFQTSVVEIATDRLRSVNPRLLLLDGERDLYVLDLKID